MVFPDGPGVVWIKDVPVPHYNHGVKLGGAGTTGSETIWSATICATLMILRHDRVQSTVERYI
jgi:hypothetical protein